MPLSDIEISTSKPLPADLVKDLTAELRALTGQVWRITTADVPGAPTLKEARGANEQSERQAILDSPVVKAALEAFPDAELEDWTPKRSKMQ